MATKSTQSIRLFTYAQVAMLAMFILVLSFALSRLFEVGKFLNLLSSESVPKTMQASSLNNFMQSLGTSTTMLAVSQSNPSRQLARQEINERLTQINFSLLNSSQGGQHLIAQLITVKLEIDELDSLVKQQILQQQNLSNMKRDFKDLVFSIFIELDSFAHDNNIEKDLLAIVLLAVQIDEQKKMHKLRQIQEELSVKLESVTKTMGDFKIPLQEDLRILSSLLIGAEGLVDQKIQSLQIIGRTRGRGSFVRNLIADIASNLQYESQVVNAATLSLAQDTKESTSVYAHLTIVVGMLTILLSIAIIYFLYKRIVSRLVLLSKQVERGVENEGASIDIVGDDEIAKLATAFSTYIARLKKQENALLEMTLTDPLTGIANRRAFEKEFAKTSMSSKINSQSMVVMLIDVDYFKLFNDNYGHSEGDDCLRKLAAELCSVVKVQNGFCARFGGEEFVAIYANTSAEQASVHAEVLIGAVENLKIKHEYSDVADVITISLGLAACAANNDSQWLIDAIVENADKALYKAKASGRNRFMVHCD